MSTISFTSAAHTGNLVLKTRVAVLMRNLKEVGRALGTVKQRRADLHTVLEFPGEVERSIGVLRTWLNLTGESYESENWDTVGTGLVNISKALSALDWKLAGDREAKRAGDPEATPGVVDSVERLRGQASLEDEVAKTDDIAKAVHESLENEIRKRFGDRFASLSQLQEEIAQSAAPAALTAAWTQYTTELYDSSEKLFGEYVELVGGIAMRDTGFDRGICRIAEDVLKPVRQIGNYTWNNLTIPARQEALSVTAARIVRLGFPEWTIWTLPLTAYELGNDFVDGSPMISDYVNELCAEEATRRAGSQSDLLVCLADAFATYFMGPAYACALILMRLDPAHPGGLVAKRVAVVLSVLRRMSMDKRPHEDLYRAITARLAVEWEAALAQIDQSRLPEAVDDDALAAPQEPTWLAADEQAAIRRHTGLTLQDQVTVQRWIAGFERFVWSKRLDLGAWPKIEEWAGKLKRNQAIAAADLGTFDELRYVLNAAWRARIAVDEGERDIDDPAELRAVAEAAEALMWRLLDRPTDGGKPRRSLQLGGQT